MGLTPEQLFESYSEIYNENGIEYEAVPKEAFLQAIREYGDQQKAIGYDNGFDNGREFEQSK